MATPNFSINKNITVPVFDIASGNYNCSQILIISAPGADEIVYSVDGGNPSKKYWGPIVVRTSATIKAFAVKQNERSDIVEINIEIQKNKAPQKGNIMVIGGAEHCKELHQKIVELAGGKDSARIVFIPTSSSEGYAAGIDRETRFRDLCGVNIDLNMVPEVNGKKDFSNLNDESNFWILPVAFKDDSITSGSQENNPDTPLVDESTLPNIDESQWVNNGHNKLVAEKLRDDNYDIVFFTGGNQARYIECLKYPDGTDTPVLAIIRELYEENGAVVCGTSAGGAVLSSVMMQGGTSYGALKEGVVYQDIDIVNYDDEYTPFVDSTDRRIWLGHGFGLLHPGFISDTHFVARGRIGRLISACLFLKEKNKRNMIGLGADEDAGIIIKPDFSGEITGATGAVIVDVSEATIAYDNVEVGNFSAKNIIVHYLEQYDTFQCDMETGKVTVTSISKTKTNIQEPEYKNGNGFFYEIDVFGKNKLVRCMGPYLVDNAASESIGAEIIDNLEDGYDEIAYRNVEAMGTVLLKFHKTEKTKAAKGSVKYNWWGRGDHSYPDLMEVNENNRYSITNIKVDLYPLNIVKYPDLSDAEHIALKSEYLKDGYSLDEWYNLFDERKKYKFGMILIPVSENELEARTFWFDYCFNDYDGDGYYTPPKLKPEGHHGGYKDYDIAEMDEAEGAAILVDGAQVGETDEFGKFVITNVRPGMKISAVYKGHCEYIVEYTLPVISKESVIIFE